MNARRRGLVGGGCATLVLALLAGGMLWWQYVSYVPPVPPPQGTLPAPNARDDFLAATQLLPPRNTGPRAVIGSSGSGPPTALPTPQLREAVQAEAPALQRLRKGLSHEYANPPVLPAQRFPEFTRYLELARALARESELARREGRPGDALQSGLDAVRMGEMTPRRGTLQHGLVGIAVQAIGLRSVENAIDAADADSAAHAARELWALDEAAPTYADTLATARDSSLFRVAALCRISNPMMARQNFTGNSGAPTPSEVGMLLQVAVTPKRTVLENYRRYLDADIARAQKPFYARGAPVPPPTDPIHSLWAPVFEHAESVWVRLQAMRRLLAARLAVRAYTLSEGHPPASLSALVPKYLPVAPQDPFAPAPLLYRVTHGKPLVYSRGPDGDDDGGWDLGGRIRANSDGDLATLRRLPGR